MSDEILHNRTALGAENRLGRHWAKHAVYYMKRIILVVLAGLIASPVFACGPTSSNSSTSTPSHERTLITSVANGQKSECTIWKDNSFATIWRPPTENNRCLPSGVSSCTT